MKASSITSLGVMKDSQDHLIFYLSKLRSQRRNNAVWVPIWNSVKIESETTLLKPLKNIARKILSHSETGIISFDPILEPALHYVRRENWAQQQERGCGNCGETYDT